MEPDWDVIIMDAQFSERANSLFIVKILRNRITKETITRLYDEDDNELDFETLKPINQPRDEK